MKVLEDIEDTLFDKYKVFELSELDSFLEGGEKKLVTINTRGTSGGSTSNGYSKLLTASDTKECWAELRNLNGIVTCVVFDCKPEVSVNTTPPFLINVDWDGPSPIFFAGLSFNPNRIESYITDSDWPISSWDMFKKTNCGCSE